MSYVETSLHTGVTAGGAAQESSLRDDLREAEFVTVSTERVAAHITKQNQQARSTMQQRIIYVGYVMVRALMLSWAVKMVVPKMDYALRYVTTAALCLILMFIGFVAAFFLGAYTLLLTVPLVAFIGFVLMQLFWPNFGKICLHWETDRIDSMTLPLAVNELAADIKAKFPEATLYVTHAGDDPILTAVRGSGFTKERVHVAVWNSGDPILDTLKYPCKPLARAND